MLTLPEIEKAVDLLNAEQKRELHRYLQDLLRENDTVQVPICAHSILDIATSRLGRILPQTNGNDDVLGEMLEERR